MLDCGNARDLISQVWTQLGCEVILPNEWTEFFDVCGEADNNEDERRNHPRYLLRDKAIISRKNQYFCIYTKDVSRSGICFISSHQLFPQEEVHLWLPTGLLCLVKIARCHRLGEKCFECAGKIHKEKVTNDEHGQ